MIGKQIVSVDQKERREIKKKSYEGRRMLRDLVVGGVVWNGKESKG